MRRVAGVVLGAVLLGGCSGAGPGPDASTSFGGSVSGSPTTAVTPTPTPTPTGSPSFSARPSGEPTPKPTRTPTPKPTPTVQPNPNPNPPPTVRPPPSYASTVGPITTELAKRMQPSWRAGCPVPLADLRYVTVTYRGFDAQVHTGELVVHADAADAVTRVFRSLFDAGYPIRSMRLVDDFDADDGASMNADNSSGFNCRNVAGTATWSEHAYGRAIDVNPVENPYVSGGSVDPPGGEAFKNRPDVPGVIHARDAVVQAFAAQGWKWGGFWSGAKDYQHFSVSGR